MIKIDSIVMGALDNNVYIVRCYAGNDVEDDLENDVEDGTEGGAPHMSPFTFVVDPSGKVPRILDALREGGDGCAAVDVSNVSAGTNSASVSANDKATNLNAIICTHFHSDHTGGLAQLVRETGAPVYVGTQDAPHIEVPRGARDVALHLHEACKVDVRVNDGDVFQTGEALQTSETLRTGGTSWQFIHTPGHSAGGICLYKPAVEPAAESPSGADVIVNGKNYGNIPVLFSGDTLFAGVTGRTDFFGSSDSDMRESLKKLAKLPDETLVLPGHNDFTTIGAERATTFRRWGVE